MPIFAAGYEVRNMGNGKFRGHAALWVANIVWGLNAPICKSVLQAADHPDGISPFALSAYRMIGAALLFWTASLLLPRERVSRRDLGLLLCASVFGIQFNQLLFLWGLSLTSPIDASIIATLVPILTMLFAALFLREPITGLKAGGVALGCFGAVLLVVLSHGGSSAVSSIRGNTLCIISATSYAVYLTAFRDVIVRYHPVTAMKWMFTFAAATAAVIYREPLAEVDYGVLSAPTLLGTAYVVACSTFLSYLCVPIGQRSLRPTVVSMYHYVQPVVAVLFSILIGLDRLGFAKSAAAACVFLGVWMVTQSKSRRQLETERQQSPGKR